MLLITNPCLTRNILFFKVVVLSAGPGPGRVLDLVAIVKIQCEDKNCLSCPTPLHAIIHLHLHLHKYTFHKNRSSMHAMSCYTNLNSLTSQFLKCFRSLNLSVEETPLHNAQSTCSGLLWEIITTILSVYSSSIVFSALITRTTISGTGSQPRTRSVGLTLSFSRIIGSASFQGARLNSPKSLSRSATSVLIGVFGLK